MIQDLSTKPRRLPPNACSSFSRARLSLKPRTGGKPKAVGRGLARSCWEEEQGTGVWTRGQGLSWDDAGVRPQLWAALWYQLNQGDQRGAEQDLLRGSWTSVWLSSMGTGSSDMAQPFTKGQCHLPQSLHRCQSLSLHSKAGAERGQELTAGTGCPWGTLGRARHPGLGFTSQHWSRLPAVSLGASLPFPEQQSRARAALAPSQ